MPTGIRPEGPFDYAQPLRRVMKDREISVRALAMDTELSRQTISRLRAGEDTNISTLQLVANTLGVHISTFFPPPVAAQTADPKKDLHTGLLRLVELLSSDK